jgi:acetolactate synthase-1/2/3 large subunit
MMKRISGAMLIRNFLQKKGHNIISGYSGGAVLPLLNSIKQSNIKFIKNSNEQCSGHFAEGLAKAQNKQKPGIIVTTSGPGITNCITPLYDAYGDGIPLLILSAQVDQRFLGTDAFQEAPAVEATRPFTKFSECIYDINKLEDTLNKAYDLAMTPRFGPVHLDIPKDVLISEININDTYSGNNDTANNDTDIIQNTAKIENTVKIENSISLINKSKKPIIIFGQGAINSSEIANFICETYNIPCCTTIHGLGVVSEEFKYSLGMLGMHGSAAANYAIQESDLIIGIGNRFDDRTIGNINGYGKNARNKENETNNNETNNNETNKGLGIIHIDNSDEQIKKVKKLFNSQKNLQIKSINIDANIFLKNVNKKINKVNRDNWLKNITNLKNTFKFDYIKLKKKIKVQDVINELDKKITQVNMDRDNILFTTGVGNHQMFTAQLITWTHPNKMLTSGSAGTMGVGLPYALGAQIDNKDKIVICIDGDGSFNMTSSDLQTAVENNIPVKIMIMNDSRQQMVYVWQKLFFEENYIGTENERNPCYKSLAEAYGMKAIKCDSFENLDSSLEFMLNYNSGPILCEYIVVPDICLPLVSPGKALDEMLLRDDKANINLDKNYIPS